MDRVVCIMNLKSYEYITLPPFTGDIQNDAERLMHENGKQKIFDHMLSVAEVSVSLAERFKLNEEKCHLAAVLHDVSAVVRPSDMLQYVKEQNLPVCEAEERFPFLLHQRLSKDIAGAYFSIGDCDVLSAIKCHTTLKHGASPYDMVLFIADKLAWDQEGTPPFYDAVYAALDVSLEKACYTYMLYMEESGRLLCPHTNWNAAENWLQSRM